MLKNGLKAFTIIVLAFLLHRVALAADVIELPPEELATESVLPVFDKPVSLKNRNVSTTGRYDANVFYGFAMTEPIANTNKLGLSLYYNFNEDHALGILYAKNFSGLSTYAQQLNSQYTLDFNRAPKPNSVMLLDYNLKAFYGKMSIAKNYVLNTVIYGSAAAGMIQYSTKSYPGVAVGLGEKFYFTRQWALRVDLRLYMNNAPDPFIDRNDLTPGQPIPSASTFQDKLTYTTNLDLGLNYLF